MIRAGGRLHAAPGGRAAFTVAEIAGVASVLAVAVLGMIGAVAAGVRLLAPERGAQAVEDGVHPVLQGPPATSRDGI